MIRILTRITTKMTSTVKMAAKMTETMKMAAKTMAMMKIKITAVTMEIKTAAEIMAVMMATTVM